MGGYMNSLTAEARAWIEANRLAWDASAPHHAKGPNWDSLLQGFATPGFSVLDDTLTRHLQSVGLEGRRVVQLGCNNGRELLSCFALGAAEGLGIDQSQAFLAQAEQLASISGAPCQFLQADINHLPAHVAGGYDVALITIGVLNWMPDLRLFFNAVAGLLKTGSRLVIYETHPFLEMFDPTSATPFTPAISYFEQAPMVLDEALVYDGSDAGSAPPSYWFLHRMSDIVNACVGAGFCIDRLEEYPHSNRETAYDIYTHQAAQLPLCYSLLATWSPAKVRDTTG